MLADRLTERLSLERVLINADNLIGDDRAVADVLENIRPAVRRGIVCSLLLIAGVTGQVLVVSAADNRHRRWPSERERSPGVAPASNRSWSAAGN